MDQTEMKQWLERRMARMDANERKMDSNQERMGANLKEMKAEMNAWLGEMKAWRGVTHACLEEEKESTREETEAVEKPQEVPEGGTDEETSGGTEDRTGEQRLAVRRHRQRKKRAQGSGGPWQKFAVVRGRFTRRAVPALLKGHVRKGPGRNRRSGVRGPGKTFRSRMEGRSLKQRQINGNVV
jgi:hypothetical protein